MRWSGERGFSFAAKIALQELAGGAQSLGMDSIPQEGPLIIASNHPGTYDGFVIISNLERDDFKMMVSGIPFFQNLPHASKYLIYSTQDVRDRMEAIRRSIAHLEKGGALVIFPSGRLDPDPAILPGAGEALSAWSRSIEVFMRKVPRAKVVLGIVSGVLSREFISHPYTKLFRNGHERRRVMEFMQVIKQMVRGKPVSINPAVSFSAPIDAEDLPLENIDRMQDAIEKNAANLLTSHRTTFCLKIF